ncbi:MAG: integrase, partial [Thermoguttaceae bacterium]
WLTYPRKKTGIPRRVPLWSETIDALKAARAQRLEPLFPGDKALFFINSSAMGYADGDGTKVGRELHRLLETAKVNRKGLSFYALRHTFQTIAEGVRDLSAVQAIMGHAASGNDMSATYRERVDDERLKAVVDHVRGWLFGIQASGARG